MLISFALKWIAGFISIYSSSQFGWSDLWKWEQNPNSQLKHKKSPHQYSPRQQQRVLGPKRWFVYSVAPSPTTVWWCWVFVLVCNPLAVCHTVHVSPCGSATRLHVHEGRGGWWCTEPRWWMSAKQNTNRVKKRDVTHSTSQCSNSLPLMQSVHTDNIPSIIRHLSAMSLRKIWNKNVDADLINLEGFPFVSLIKPIFYWLFRWKSQIWAYISSRYVYPLWNLMKLDSTEQKKKKKTSAL